jgi:hypothetical protein
MEYIQYIKMKYTTHFAAHFITVAIQLLALVARSPDSAIYLDSDFFNR